MNERDEQMREVLPDIARERAEERERDRAGEDPSTAELASAGSSTRDDDLGGDDQPRTSSATATATQERRTAADMAQPPQAADTARPPEAGAIGEDARGRQPVGPGAGQATAEDTRTALFTDDDASDYQARWQEIQADFVDDPREAVEQADTLVAELMQRLAETFARERAGLEGQWDRGDEVSTEDLRIALQRYRSFFGRLLSL
jgi:hypothetical protein